MPVADDVGSGHLASRVRRLLTSAPVLAIDLGKYKCVACVDRSATEHTFQTMDTSRIDRLISRTRPAVVVIEACSLAGWRSEEHTSELQSLRHLVCRLLLEKKKQQE